MKKAKRLVSFLMAIVLMSSFAIAAQAAGDDSARAVIGADLSEEETAEVYEMFGIEQGSVAQLSVTNEEEREYLDGVVDDSMIGSKSISCVYIKLLDEGSGLKLTTENINWCTTAVYENALVTAGVYDADVRIAAPFAVSGTAALTGIYKAYEDMTGEKLSEVAKETAVEELVITSEIADTIGGEDAALVVNELKKILDQTADMSDEELTEEILFIAEQCNVTLTDEQIGQLISLVRSLEKLDADEIISKVKKVGETIEKISEASEKAGGFFESIKNFFSSVVDFFAKLFK